MISFSYDAFIRKQCLTEVGLGIPNTLWTKVEDYIKDKEVWRQQLITGSKWSDLGSDMGLESILKVYFEHLLVPDNFILASFSLELNKTNAFDGNYGKYDIEVLNASNTLNNNKEIKVRIAIYLFRIIEISAENILRSLYHELIHLDEAIKAIKNVGIDKLTTILTPFQWTDVNSLLNKPENKTEFDYVNSKDERNTYAGDLALQLFYKYRQYFKEQNVKEQEYFIRTKIVPNIKNEFSQSIQHNFIDNLLKSNKFYISLIKQLTALAMSVSINV